VTDAEHAAQYLAENPPTYTESIYPTIIGGVTNMAKPERKPTPRELSAQIADERKAMRKKRAEQIDNLLDMRIWASKMLEKTNNEEYGDKVFAIDCELKKLTETE
jgi:hypothetical protein